MSSGSTRPPTSSRCPRATSPSATCTSRRSPPGVPVLSSARAGGAEIVAGGDNGWVVARGRPSAPIARRPRPRCATRRRGGSGRARARLRRALHLRRPGGGLHRPLRRSFAADRRRPPGARPNPRFSLINRGRGITLRQFDAAGRDPPCSSTATAASPRRWATSITPSRIRLLPRTAEAVRRLNEAGIAGGDGHQPGGHRARLLLRGRAATRSTRAWSGSSRRAARASTALYVCTHHPREGEPPYPRRLRLPQAAPRTPACAPRASSTSTCGASVMIGDKISDVAAGQSVGAAGVLVLTGYGRGEWEHQRHGWTDQAGPRGRRSARRGRLGARPRRGRAGADVFPVQRLIDAARRASRAGAWSWSATSSPTSTSTASPRGSRARRRSSSCASPTARCGWAARANAAHNVQALGAHVAAGGPGWASDDAGAEVHALFAPGGHRAPTASSREPGRRTPVKTRIMAGGYESTRQQVVRLDREPEAGIVGPTRRRG